MPAVEQRAGGEADRSGLEVGLDDVQCGAARR
jgi:hypothetical protein